MKLLGEEVAHWCPICFQGWAISWCPSCDSIKKLDVAGVEQRQDTVRAKIKLKSKLARRGD